MEPENNKVFQPIPGTFGGLTGVHSGQIGGRWIEREAIPWCITHDEQWHEYTAIMSGCFVGSTNKPCADKSTGGPDHKWWKDQ